jgi:predicted nucleic acid-binding protein
VGRRQSSYSIAKTASSVRVYLDSSALLKRVLREVEREGFAGALRGFIDEGADLFSSSLAWVEVSRTIRVRLEAEAPRRIIDLIQIALSGIEEFPISEQVIEIAQRMSPASIRSLDAIHLASATLLGADLVCAYDQRLLGAAEELGFRTASPGLVR